MSKKFATLKKSSDDIERLIKEIDKANSPNGSDSKNDHRFWKIDRDKSGNGSAIIRFLPEPEVDGDDGMPWIRLFDHGFKGPTGKWYIENSLTTLNQKDPVSEYNSQLWNSTTDDNSWQRKQARNQKRRLHYISNIYVVSDPKHPENEGKVFLFIYGKKIKDKISMMMKPEFEGDVRVNPFHLWKGANFKLRIRTVDGYPNYDQSLFDAPKPLFDDDALIEAVYNKQYSLKEFLDPKNFKSYDELKARLDEVLAEGKDIISTAAPIQRRVKTVEDEEVVNSSPPFDMDDDDGDDELAAFRRLAS